MAHACELPKLDNAVELETISAAALLVKYAAAAGRIPAEHALRAAARLGSRIVERESSAANAASACSAGARERAIIAKMIGDCVQHLGSTALTAANVLAAGGRLQTQEAADNLLAVLMQLCVWLLSDTAACGAGDQTHLAQEGAQQVLKCLLADKRHVARALAATSMGHRLKLAQHIASWTSRASSQNNVRRLPPLAFAATALRMLCNGEPFSAGCLHTADGCTRLHMQASVLPS